MNFYCFWGNRIKTQKYTTASNKRKGQQNNKTKISQREFANKNKQQNI